MKRMMIRWLLSIVLVLLVAGMRVQATSLDGTVTPVYENFHHVFHNNDKAVGFVRLNQGFTILAGATAYLDTFITVSGPIDLRDTGRMSLSCDMYLSSVVTLSSGGKISGNKNVLFLGDDLTIPANKRISILTDTIIDGRGHTLIFDTNAEIFVDVNATLTLRNVVLTNVANTLIDPVISFSSKTSFLALQNVGWWMASDYTFSVGRLFIHDDVVMSGSTRFIYASDQQSYITPCSNWYFDKGMTLFYTSTPNNLLQMQHKTSTLIFDNASLVVSTTGMRLSKGRLCLDNQVTLSTDSSAFDTTGRVRVANDSAGGTGVSSVAWSPDNFSEDQYVGVIENDSGGGPRLQMYSFNNSTFVLTPITTFSVDNNGSNNVNRPGIFIAWHPNGKRIAVLDVADTSATTIRILAFNGVSLTSVSTQGLGVAGNTKSIAWHPSGNFLAIVVDEMLMIYSFNGNALSVSPIASRSYTGAVMTSVAWNFNGTLLALGGSVTGTDADAPSPFTIADRVRVFSFNGATLTAKASASFSTNNPGAYTVAWHPYQNILAVGGSLVEAGVGTNIDAITVYAFTGSSLTPITTVNPHFLAVNVARVYALSWHPSGSFLNAGTFSDANHFFLYKFTGSSLQLQQSFSYGPPVTPRINTVPWSHNGAFFADGGNGPGLTDIAHDFFEIYKVSFTFPKALIFGDSAKGSAFDLDISVLAGARVGLFGNIFYDNAS